MRRRAFRLEERSLLAIPPHRAASPIPPQPAEQPMSSSAARELYVSGGKAACAPAPAPAPERGPPPALPGVHGQPALKRSLGSELAAQNRALRQRCDELIAQNAEYRVRAAEFEAVLGDLRARAERAESAEQRLRSDVKHIIRRNEVLEQLSAQARAPPDERPPAPPPPPAAMEVADADELDASSESERTSALEAREPPQPPSPRHTHAFLARVEKGLARELERVSTTTQREACAGGGECRAGAAELARSAARSQFWQLADMRKEVEGLQRYAQAMQAFSDSLAAQLRAAERRGDALAGRLIEQERAAADELERLRAQLREVRWRARAPVRAARRVRARDAHRLFALPSRLCPPARPRPLPPAPPTHPGAQAQAQLAAAHESAAQWEERAACAQGAAERMLGLHAQLSEAAASLGASDQTAASLLEALRGRLGGSLALRLAEKLDGLVAGGGGAAAPAPSPSEAPATHADEASPPSPRADAEATAAAPAGGEADPRAAAASTSRARASFMVAKAYLLPRRRRSSAESGEGGGARPE